MTTPDHASRRTVAKGIAWSIPVIGVGAVAPHATASTAACEAAVLTSSCTTFTNANSTSTPTFCVTPGIAIQPGSTFAVALSGAFLSSTPTATGNFLTYANLTSISATMATFTVISTIPAGVTACLTVVFTSTFTGTATISFSARNINGGLDCSGVITTKTQNGNKSKKSFCS